jgi:hypothetical protein
MNLSDAAAVYAGTTEAQAVYYGAKKIWPFSGWRQVGSTILGSAAGDQLGYAVTINSAGDRIAASSPYNDEAGSNTGSVRVLQWNGTAWGQMGASILGNTTPVNTLGQSLSMSDDGSILAVSSLTGYVRVYEWNGTAWGQKGSDIYQLTGSPSTGQAKFGESISLSGDGTILAIGVPSGNSYTGYVRVYDWNGTSWTQRGLNITEAGSRVGQSVALSEDGSKLAIGARYNNIGASNAGTVRVLEWDGSTWLQLGQTIEGSVAGDESGWSVTINSLGTRIAIGARYHDLPSGDAGNTRMFEWDGTAWGQLGSSILGAAGNDWSGASVSLNATGDIVAIGSERADSGGTDSGHVRVYQWSGTSWSQIGATIDGAAAGDNFFPVALNAAGTRLIAGGKFNDAAGANAGHAKVFEFVV